MTPLLPSRNAYSYSLLAPLILPLIHPIIAASAPPTLSMDTPPPIAQCAAGTFTWQGGRPPYTLSVRDSHSGTSVFSNSGLTDTVFHWVAAVAAGTDLTVELTDTGVSGARGARLEDNFVVEEGSDACLPSNSGTPSSSSITSEQASDTSPPTSTSHTQPTTSAVTPTSSSSDSTAAATTNVNTDTDTPPAGSPSSSDGAASSQTLTGSAAGTTDSTGNASSPPTTAGGSSIGLATTSSSGRSTSTSTGGTSSSGRAGAGMMIAGAAIGSLVAGFVLATGLFCVWKARRARRGVVFCGRWRQRRGRGRLEPYEYPSADPDPTFTHPTSVATLPPPQRENALNFDGAPHQPNANADPVVRERQGPGKSRWDGFLSPSIQPTTSQRADLVTLNGAERSRVMDAVDGAEGSHEIRTDDFVRRRWDLGDLDVQEALRLGFDLADYSERSASTAPPPYSQIA